MNGLVTAATGLFGSRHVRATPAPDPPDAPRVTVLDELTEAGTPDHLEVDRPALEFAQGGTRAAVLAGQFVAEYGDDRARRDAPRRRVAGERA